MNSPSVSESELAASKRISQKLFDETIQQYMVDFEMDAVSALADSIGFLQTQKVDLSLIVQDASVYDAVSGEARHEILQVLEQLDAARKSNIDSQTLPQIYELLNTFRKHCDDSLAKRYLAGKHNAYDTLRAYFELSDFKLPNRSEAISVREIIAVFAALLKGQPDLLDENGFVMIKNLLESNPDFETASNLLKLMAECCKKHETNRQRMMEILQELAVNPLGRYVTEAKTFANANLLIRCLVLNDDIRVEFSKNYEHAKILCELLLNDLIGLLKGTNLHEPSIADLMKTMSGLLVRNEYCTKAEDLGLIEIVIKLMDSYTKNDKIVRQAFMVLKTLARNDECKARIRRSGGIPSIVSALDYHRSFNDVKLIALGMECASALTLRSPDIGQAFYAENFIELIYQIMKKFNDDVLIMRNCSWTIRNMVSRHADMKKDFLENDIESILNDCRRKFGKRYEFDFKAALRDLGCAVDLKEEWTGYGGKISTQQKQAK